MFLSEKVNGTNIEAFQPLIPEVLQRWAIEEEGWVFFGISEDMEAVGIVALSTFADTARIRYLYLLSECRGRGIMEWAVTRIMFDLYEEGYQWLEMDYIPSEYPMIDELAHRLEFDITKTDRAYFRFKASDIKNCKAASFVPQSIMRMKVLPPDKKQELYRMIRESGYDLNQLKGAVDDKDTDKSLNEYSLVYLEREVPKGALLVQDTSESKLPEGAAAFGKIYPEPASVNLMLIYVGTFQTRAPLYLLSGLCRNVTKDFKENAILTGYFSLGHVTNLFEEALGVKGNREVTARLSLTNLERFYDEETDDSELEF